VLKIQQLLVRRVFFTASDINQYSSMERNEADNVTVHKVIRKREK
jgi:hypothetical protein